MTQGRLLRVLGLGFGLAVIVGNTIGGGILRTPGEVAAHLPRSGLFLAVWVVGGLYALLGALQIAELGAMLPRSGGQYTFSRHALGDYAGFVVGWSDWLSTCGTTAAVSLLVGDFGVMLTGSPANLAPRVAVAVAIGFALAQWRGIGGGSLVQNVTSAAKALAFLVVIVAALTWSAGAGDGGEPAIAPAGWTMATAFLLSLQSVIYTYDGWTAVVYFSEEVRDSARDVPRALIGGVLLIIAIYLLTNLALLHVLSVEGLSGDPFALGTVAGRLAGPRGMTALLVVAIVSLLSAVNANHLMASRVLFAMSRDGLFPARATDVNAGGTPTVALALSTLVALLFIVFGRTFGQVITVLSFFFVANYSLSFISLFVLRAREPDRARPYRVWGYPWTTALALIGSIAFLVGAVAGDPRHSLFALLLLAASYPVYRLVRR